MERAGAKLKRVRDRLKLTYRDVEQASQKIASRHGNDEFAIALSRLADIENKGTVPTVYRLYSLCVIYRLELEEVLKWYGVPAAQIAAEAVMTGLPHTHRAALGERPAAAEAGLNEEVDLSKTTLLSHVVRHWGKNALSFLDGLDLRQFCYAFIGLEDWSMYPIIRPGSLVAIDERRRKIASSGWGTEYERPIYFLEHRNGNAWGWCTIQSDRLVVQPHPGSQQPANSYAWPAEIDVIGQITGVAMVLEEMRPRRSRTAVNPAAFQSR